MAQTFSLSFTRLVLKPSQSLQLPQGIFAVFVDSGSVNLGGTQIASGQARISNHETTLSALANAEATCLIFGLSCGKPWQGASEVAEIEAAFPALLRVDEVAFPPGAIAYRHVHPGPGYRHLRWGSLQLEADEHSFQASPGTTWFEPANSPVKATAALDFDETRFVRCMLLPPKFQGQPTIQILDPNEAEKPKRQITHRHIDHIIETGP